jgi:Lipocalin-like domain
MLRLFIAVLLLFPCASSWADDASKLVGVWKLNSFVTEIVQTKERRNAYGANPNGYLIITPERFMSIITAEGRKPPQTDEDRINGFRSMYAFTGPHRVEGDRLITKVEVAWNEAWVGTDQTRIFRIEGDKLFIESIPVPAATANPATANYPGALTRGIVEWERSK